MFFPSVLEKRHSLYYSREHPNELGTVLQRVCCSYTELHMCMSRGPSHQVLPSHFPAPSRFYRSFSVSQPIPFPLLPSPGGEPQRRFDRKLERKFKIKFFAFFNIIYCHGCHISLPLSSNCRGTWNKNVVKRCRIIQETILKHEKKRYTSGDKLSLLYMAHVIF